MVFQSRPFGPSHALHPGEFKLLEVTFRCPTHSFRWRAARKPVWYRSPKLLRHAVMLFFFLFLLHVAYDHQVKGGGPRGSASVEAYCPFGGLESLYQFLTTGGFIRRIEPSAMILFAALLLVTVIASRGFCGWICPFGSIQEWLGLIGRKLLGKRFNPTGRWDRAMRNLKYAIRDALRCLDLFEDYCVVTQRVRAGHRRACSRPRCRTRLTSQSLDDSHDFSAGTPLFWGFHRAARWTSVREGCRRLSGTHGGSMNRTTVVAHAGGVLAVVATAPGLLADMQASLVPSIPSPTLRWGPS